MSLHFFLGQTGGEVVSKSLTECSDDSEINTETDIKLGAKDNCSGS